MSRNRRHCSLFAAFLLVACSSNDSPDHTEHAPAAQPPSAQSTPSTQAPTDVARVNKVLDPAGFSDPQVRAAYEAAKQYAHVLEEVYCYCRCKENIGHRALVECFETGHATNCSVCLNEAVIAAKMTKDGKTPKEIQKAIDALYAG
jgi:hypothetical protein